MSPQIILGREMLNIRFSFIQIAHSFERLGHLLAVAASPVNPLVAGTTGKLARRPPGCPRPAPRLVLQGGTWARCGAVGEQRHG